ncbi:UTRA domain-containing protein [Halomonas titanicae]|uniref:UTRA domain-containing protein n=1 Tax=Vreelandella titanicae TaxID=664683 RepID=UPI001F361DBE|nr:UTRA domain-containing protein [Halomonas titanicae]MCE7521023.1 UTRA domain-containing protein [Halomonas titanicae]
MTTTLPHATPFSADNALPRLTPPTSRLQQALLGMLAEEAPSATGRLPSERQMMERFSTTRITLREALMQLEAEGRIYRESRRGWFISPPRLRYDLLASLPFKEMVASQQRCPETEVLKAIQCPAQPKVAARLGILEGAPVFHIIRARRIDGRPVLYVEHYLRADCFPGILAHDLVTCSLTELYRSHYGIRISRVSFELCSTVLHCRAAEALRAASGGPAQRVTRINYDQNGRAIDYDDELWRHDAIELTVSAAPQGT